MQISFITVYVLLYALTSVYNGDVKRKRVRICHRACFQRPDRDQLQSTRS